MIASTLGFIPGDLGLSAFGCDPHGLKKPVSKPVSESHRPRLTIFVKHCE